MAKDNAELKPVPVRRRSASRVSSIQILYQSQITDRTSEDFAPDFLTYYAPDVSKSFRVKDLDHEHLNALYTGVEKEMAELDNDIASSLASGWTIERLPLIELTLLRCGAFELRFMPHIPARAVVSEYAAISDSCGCEVAFVNAVLDRLSRIVRTVEMGTV